MRTYRDELDRRERRKLILWGVGFALGIIVLVAAFYGALVLLAGME